MSERNDLIFYIGYLLLSDEVRMDHKKCFDEWIQKSTANKSSELRNSAMVAIKGMANHLAAGDPKRPLETSSIFGFERGLWKRKQELERTREKE